MLVCLKFVMVLLMDTLLLYTGKFGMIKKGTNDGLKLMKSYNYALQSHKFGDDYGIRNRPFLSHKNVVTLRNMTFYSHKAYRM
jgi:hypothetical protein